MGGKAGSFQFAEKLPPVRRPTTEKGSRSRLRGAYYPAASDVPVTVKRNKLGRPAKDVEVEPIPLSKTDVAAQAEGRTTPNIEYNDIAARIPVLRAQVIAQQEVENAELARRRKIKFSQRGKDFATVWSNLLNYVAARNEDLVSINAYARKLIETKKLKGDKQIKARKKIIQDLDDIASALKARRDQTVPKAEISRTQLAEQEAVANQRAQKRMDTEKVNDAARVAALREALSEEDKINAEKADKYSVQTEFIAQETGFAKKQKDISKYKQEMLDTREELINALSIGDINTALGILRDASVLESVKPQYRKAFDLVTKELQKIDFSQMNVVLENKAVRERTLPADRVAQYDPATNTLLLSARSATNGAIIQHELIHAATVKVLRDYQDAEARKELTPSQREGAEHMMRLYNFVKKQKTTSGKAFSEVFPAPMENVYEFVAYGMMEPAFQKELAQLHSQNLRPQSKGGKNLWKQFMDAVASVLGIADKEGNVLAELSGAFRQILTSPTDVVLDVAPLAARRQRQQRTPPPPENLAPSTTDNAYNSTRAQLEPKDRKSFDLKEFFRYWFSSREGIERFIKNFADGQRKFRTLRRNMDLSRELIFTGENQNDAASAIDAAPSGIEMRQKNLQPLFDKVRGYLQELSQRTGRSYKDEMARVSTYFKAETIKQRRVDKYMRDVPLSTTPNIQLRNGKVVSAADLREMIYSKVMDKNRTEVMSDAERNSLHKTLQTLAFADVRTKTPSQYVDPLGYTSADIYKSREVAERNEQYVVSDPRPTDFNDASFDVIYGTDSTPRYSVELVDQILSDLRNDPNQNLIKDLRDTIMEIEKLKRQYDSDGGYLSLPARNFIKFYGWDKYVPLKGRPNEQGELQKVSELDDSLFDNGPNFGAAYRLDVIERAEGRSVDSDDPILMTMIDANRAATRSARADVMPAVFNLIRQRKIAGKVYDDKPITFEERHNRLVDLDRFRSPNQFFLYKDNGDIIVAKIDDPDIVEALRPKFMPKQALRNAIDRITSGMASGHTRYNIKFPPYDFVRNVFFNSQAIFKEYGPKFGAKYFANVARAVSEGRFKSTWKIGTAYHSNNLGELKRLAEQDPFYAAAYEYLDNGGRVAYVQSFQTQRQLDDELARLADGVPFYQGTLNKLRFWADRYSDMFETIARVEAYRLLKDYNMNERGMAEQDAVRDAVYNTKNLTNFQKRGASIVSKWFNSLYMFASPAITGAVATYDILYDAFNTDLDKEFERHNAGQSNQVTKAENALTRARKFEGSDEDKAKKIEKAQKDLDEAKAAYDEKKKEYVKNLAPKVKNARILITAMLGTGMLLYAMARTAADDDDEGRNQVAIDDKALWTRNARLPTTFLTGDKDSRPINIPWGFGPGAFAASGAQLAAFMAGDIEAPDMMGNLISISTDSFLPLPASRYNPLDNMGTWFFTSIFPSIGRPFLEYTFNVDSLGREIYRENYSRYGPVYSGTDSMQNAYKDFAVWVEGLTDGEVQIDPSILRHFTSAYFDALGSFAADATDLASLTLGRREFNAKQDLLVLDSFIGAKTSYDAKRFAELGGDIKQMREKMNAAKNSPNPDVALNYQMRNTKDQYMIDVYDQYISQINDVRNDMKKIRTSGMQPKERDAALKEYRTYRDMLMRNVTLQLDEIEKNFN